MIGIVTDSTSQLSPELRDRYDIRVVPITVIVNGVEYQEGVTIDADDFYKHWEAGQPRYRRRSPALASSSRPIAS